MNTQALNGQYETLFKSEKSRRTFRLDTGSGLQVVLLILAATLPVAVLSVITIWAISFGAQAYLAAAFWGIGFVFLALTIDNDEGHQAVLAGSGLGLMTLAWLSSRIAPEFGLIAGLVLAAWLAAPVVRCLAMRAVD